MNQEEEIADKKKVFTGNYIQYIYVLVFVCVVDMLEQCYFFSFLVITSSMVCVSIANICIDHKMYIVHHP